MQVRQSILSLALGAGFALPAAAQLHTIAAEANPASSLKANTLAQPAPALPDAAKVATKADAETFAAAEFAFADADKNLKLTKAEFLAFDKKRQEIEKEKLANQGDKAAPPASASTPAQPAPFDAPVATADAQFAGIAGAATAIDKASFVAARLAVFAKADGDADGRLNAGENAKFAALIAGKPAL